MLRQSTQTSTGAPAMLAAPVFLLVYGVIRHLSHHRSPSVGWTLGHSAWLIGLILFAVALPWLRAQAAGWPRTSTALFWLAAAGLVASVAQASVDIVAGLLADDHAGMVRISGQVKAIPGVELFVYKLGPALFYTALVGFALVLVRQGRAATWQAVLVVLGTLAPLLTLDAIPLAALCLLFGFAPLVVSYRGRVRGQP